MWCFDQDKNKDNRDNDEQRCKLTPQVTKHDNDNGQEHSSGFAWNLLKLVMLLCYS